MAILSDGSPCLTNEPLSVWNIFRPANWFLVLLMGCLPCLVRHLDHMKYRHSSSQCSPVTDNEQQVHERATAWPEGPPKFIACLRQATAIQDRRPEYTYKNYCTTTLLQQRTRARRRYTSTFKQAQRPVEASVCACYLAWLQRLSQPGL
jgi:hypothetical protein